MATETVPGTVSALAALEQARSVLYDNHCDARALIALLEKMEFSDAMATVNNGSDYELVHAVELLLTHLRDTSLGAANAAMACAHAEGVTQHG